VLIYLIMYLQDFSVQFLIVLILILILIVLNVHTVLYIFICTRIPSCSASEPRCSVISVNFIRLLIDFHICTCVYLWGRPVSVSSYTVVRILIMSYLATFLGTVLMCRKAVNQSINQSINLRTLIIKFNSIQFTSMSSFHSIQLVNYAYIYWEAW